MKKNLPRWKLHLSPARPARALWGVPDGQSAGIKIKFSLICKNFNLLIFKMNHLKTNPAFLVAFEMFFDYPLVRDKPLFAWCNLAYFNLWLVTKSSQILRNQHCYSGVYDRRLAAMWLCFVFASPLLGVWWSLLGPAVISLGKKARSGRRLYNDDQVHHNT